MIVSDKLYYYYQRIDSAVHTVKLHDYYDRCKWYYDYITANSSELYNHILLREMIKKLLSARY